MKANSYFLLFTLSPLLAMAQPVITNTNRPLAGDAMSFLATNDLFTLPIGPEQVWDLSGLDFMPQYTQYWLDPAAAPGASSFPLADLASTDASGEFHVFWGGSPDTMVHLGTYITGDDPFIPIDPLVTMIYPCSLGTEWTDLFQPYPSPADTVHVVADSYGTLILPGMVVNDVLALHQETGGMINEQMSITGRTLIFYHPGVRWWVAEAHITSYWHFGELDTTFYYASIRDFSTIGMAENVVNDELDLWPVPASGTLNVRWQGATTNATAQVFDATGRVRLTPTVGTSAGRTHIDVRSLEPGHYVLRLRDGKGMVVSSFVVE